MRKQELTRKQIYSVTSRHIAYFGLGLLFTILLMLLPVIIILTTAVFGSENSSSTVSNPTPLNAKDMAEVAFIMLLPLLLGIMSAFTYFVDLIRMNIKSIEEVEDGTKTLKSISHGGKETNLGVKIKVTSEKDGTKKLIMYHGTWKYDIGGSKSKYKYKKRYYYLAWSKIVIYTEYIPIRENVEYSEKRNRKNR